MAKFTQDHISLEPCFSFLKKNFMRIKFRARQVKDMTQKLVEWVIAQWICTHNNGKFKGSKEPANSSNRKLFHEVPSE